MTDDGPVPVVWVRRIDRGWWRCWYSPPLVDEPLLLAEAHSADDAVREGLERLRRLGERDA